MCSSASFSSWEPAAHGRHRYWSAFLSRHFTGQARHEKVAKFSLRLGTQRVVCFWASVLGSVLSPFTKAIFPQPDSFVSLSWFRTWAGKEGIVHSNNQ